MTTVFYDTNSVPSDGNSLIYDSDTSLMRWGSIGFVSVVFSDFGDTPEYSYDSATQGSYVSGSGGTVTGGGLAGQPLTSGKLYGPLDGTQLTISGTQGDVVIVSKSV